MRYVESTEFPKYSFGDGLSYSHFSYTLLSAPSKDEPCVRICVRNEGTRKAHAVPQLYLSRRTGIVTARVRALCAFEKIELCAGEEREVALRIPRDALTQVDAQMCERYVGGRFDWFVRDGGAIHLHGSACL
jgi:beta-glucosidase